MCLIAVSGKGQKKYSEFFIEALKKASITNTDGIGYSYKRDKSPEKVWISKGFKDFDKFIACLKHKRLKDEDELIVHLRIGNKGAKTSDMNHPFVLSTDTDEILANNEYVKGTTMCHNGTFHEYSEHNSNLSDTFFFIKSFMGIPEILKLLKRDKDLFKDVFKRILLRNRLAFIFNDSTPLVLLGEFKEDQGYFFSNDSYKKNVTNVGGYDYYDTAYSDSWAGDGWRATRARENNVQRLLDRTPSLDEIQWRADQTSGVREDDLAHLNDTLEKIAKGGAYPNSKTYLEDNQQHSRIRQLTPAGSRIRNGIGLLECDAKLDIIPNINTKLFYNKSNSRCMYAHFGESLYIPRVYENNQYFETKFVPSVFNYKHFVLECMTEKKDCQLMRGENYIIDDFDSFPVQGHPPFHKLALQSAPTLYTGMVYITVEQMLAHCRVRPVKELTTVYTDVFRLIKNYDNLSKNNLSQSSKAIKGAIAKGMSTGITYKHTYNLDLRALKIYNNYLMIALYPETITTPGFFNQVQELDSKSILLN